ncbi:hypothetical protein A6U97_25945 [Agrobacterium tumefaciens]|nr:hypothetical protein A6U97_25945 [Agrobacterium tumefaciens]
MKPFARTAAYTAAMVSISEISTGSKNSPLKIELRMFLTVNCVDVAGVLNLFGSLALPNGLLVVKNARLAGQGERMDGPAVKDAERG